MRSESGGKGRAVTVLVIASLAMVATLPGRTFGLGLITEPVIAELGISRVDFTMLNLWATLLGALFVLVTGPALDRFGIRWTTAAVLGLFAGAVVWLSQLPGPGALLPVLILVRGLGQSSLSLAAIAVVGKCFRRRLSVAMGVFAVVTALLFVGAILGVGEMVEMESLGWRGTWLVMGVAVFVLGWVVVMVLREPAGEMEGGDGEVPMRGMTLRAALGSPVLWALTLGTGIYYFSFTGITLLNESVVISCGFDRGASAGLLAVLMGAGLLGNLGCGWLAERVSVLAIFGGAMVVFGMCLLGFSQLAGSVNGLYAVGAGMGIGGGAVTVVFFTGFAQAFGRGTLGRIQGVAQAATVAASGTGPLYFAWAFERSGSVSYSGAFSVLAPLSVAVGIWAFFLRLPKDGDREGVGSDEEGEAP